MRRLVPAIFVLFALSACKSPEERACDKTVALHEAAIASATLPDDGRTHRDRERACLEGLGRLREELRPDQDAWFVYLRCLTEADSMSQQFECLSPLNVEQVQRGLQQPN